MIVDLIIVCLIICLWRKINRVDDLATQLLAESIIKRRKKIAKLLKDGVKND